MKKKIFKREGGEEVGFGRRSREVEKCDDHTLKQPHLCPCGSVGQINSCRFLRKMTLLRIVLLWKFNLVITNLISLPAA